MENHNHTIIRGLKTRIINYFCFDKIKKVDIILFKIK